MSPCNEPAPSQQWKPSLTNIRECTLFPLHLHPQNNRSMLSISFPSSTGAIGRNEESRYRVMQCDC